MPSDAEIMAEALTELNNGTGVLVKLFEAGWTQEKMKKLKDAIASHKDAGEFDNALMLYLDLAWSSNCDVSLKFDAIQLRYSVVIADTPHNNHKEHRRLIVSMCNQYGDYGRKVLEGWNGYYE